MADNIALNAGSGGSTLATDEVGGIHYQLVKLAYGALDAATLVSGAAGLPVAQQGSWSATVSGTVAASQSGAWSVSITGTPAVSVSGSVAVTQSGSWSLAANQSVNLAQLASTTPDTNSGLKSAGTLRVVIATDQVQLSNALKVDGSAVTQPVSGTVSITANSAVNVAQINGVAPSTGNGASGTGVQRVTLASDSTGQVSLAPKTSGGLSVSRTISAASTNATSVKASAGQLYSVMASNTNAAARYLKIYNKASAPTVGSDTPVMTILIPPNSSGVVATWESGLAFGTGIALALTTGVTDADTGAVAANEIVAHLFYA